ncbi:MAG: HAMP domain-containing protein, partial [Acidobacteriaceae bacterium]|nr:HAMP domain-containing protein [Acidobacteriaceae bacterium]
MSAVRDTAKLLGKSGIAFLIAFVLFLLFLLIGRSALATLCFLALIPPAIILAIRALRWLHRNSLWSLRNRLLVVYALIGALPILLLFLLAGIGLWMAVNELAIYLASSALERRVESVNSSVETLRHMAADTRQAALPEIARAFSRTLPGIAFYIKDENGEYRSPANARPITIPPGWGDVNGLLVDDGHFYAWAHHIQRGEEITALAPLSDETVENLVPHLGIILLFETHKPLTNESPATTGPFLLTRRGTRNDPQFDFSLDSSSRSRQTQRIPPAVNRLDIPVFIPTTLSHYHLGTPGKSYEGILEVYSRPSAVWRSFFSRAEAIRGFLFDTLIIVTIVFVVVELIAMLLGVRLARRITRAVNQLYEGTRRVISGDFRQRIPVPDHDQLGELSESFNRMTGNLERLLLIEKEKERLQTELEIAREVQSQLYPKDAPPICGLKLTVRCDPARMVSGDYYDYQDIGRGKLAFAIGDVAGKGISAALLMATLQAALRAQIMQYHPERGNGRSR